MFSDRFQKVLSDYPEAVRDLRRFTALLKDIFPREQKITRLLIYLHELGIYKEIEQQDVITNQFVNRQKKRLVDEYSIDENKAHWAVMIWCACYGRDILGKVIESEIVWEVMQSGKSEEVSANVDAFWIKIITALSKEPRDIRSFKKDGTPGPWFSAGIKNEGILISNAMDSKPSVLLVKPVSVTKDEFRDIYMLYKPWKEDNSYRGKAMKIIKIAPLIFALIYEFDTDNHVINLENQTVNHLLYGDGTIVRHNMEQITVLFKDYEKTFAFPDAFAGELFALDPVLDIEIKRLLKKA